MDYGTIENVNTIVKVSVFCLSSLRNEVKKLFYVQFFIKFDSFFPFDFNIAKVHIFCSFLKKDYCCFRPKMTFIGSQFQKNYHVLDFVLVVLVLKLRLRNFLMLEQCKPLKGIRKMI